MSSSRITEDPGKLMTKWMEVYLNFQILKSTDPLLTNTLREVKRLLAECNEWIMMFFDQMGVEPEGLG